MEQIKPIILAIHIIAGSTALIAGLFNMIARKGGRRHRSAGKVFANSMYAVAGSAVVLSIITSSVFFFCIGVFSFYMTWNGQRAAKYRTVEFTGKDLVVLSIGIANTIFMLLYGNVILIGLGVLSALLVFREIMLLIRTRRGWKAPANAWLLRHIGMIVGSYISTLTAFLVVNAPAGPWPFWLPWALPSIVLVPVIVFWSRKIASRKVRTPQPIELEDAM